MKDVMDQIPAVESGREGAGDSPVIRSTGLARSFGDHVAVDGIDLEVQPGELFALLGPNGAGKTTTIKMLCCLLQPSDGSATILGHDIRTSPYAVKQVIDISPQETAIAEHLDARENLELMAGLNQVETAVMKERTASLLDMMGLTERASQKVKKYSGGMKRRLSIAMALVSDPQVLFLDEPTLGLDPQSRRAIWDYIASLKGSKTIVHTTHYLEEADALADRIAIIDEGKIIAMGTPDELKKSISDGQAMTIQTSGLDDSGVEALRTVYPNLTRVDGGVEIRADDVDLYAVADVLRPRGIRIESAHRMIVTLDDVFLELTGKQLRA